MDDGTALRQRVDELAQLPLSVLRTRTSELDELLGSESSDVRSEALSLVVKLSGVYPESVTDLAPSVVELLGDDDLQEDASQVLAHIAPEEPTAVEPHLPLLITAVDAGGDVTVNVTYVLSVLAPERHDTLARRGVLNKLLSLTSHENPAVRTNATSALGDVASGEPDALVDEAETLQECLRDSTPDVQKNAAYTLGHLARTSPGTVFGATEELCQLLESPDRAVRTSAVYALCETAMPTEPVEDRAIEALIECLRADRQSVRRHASFLLAAVASTDPDSVEPHEEHLARHAKDADFRVRQNLRSTLETLKETVPEAMD